VDRCELYDQELKLRAEICLYLQGAFGLSPKISEPGISIENIQVPGLVSIGPGKQVISDSGSMRYHVTLLLEPTVGLYSIRKNPSLYSV
jgi:hypothetical protein